jgi:hypothetical protein
MGIFSFILGQNEEDRLVNDFFKIAQEMNLPKASKCLEKMSDQGLLKITNKIDNLIKNEPDYMVFNALLYAEFAKRPHLNNPFKR